MRQIILNSGGAIVARTPRPMVEPNHILVRVRYSMISVGTEVASIRPSAPSQGQASTMSQAKAYASTANRYLGLAAANPAKAFRKLGQMAKNRIAKVMPEKKEPPRPAVELGAVTWEKQAATGFESSGGSFKMTSDTSAASYQATTAPITLVEGLVPIIKIKGMVEKGKISIGLLNETKDQWLGARVYDEGALEDNLVFDTKGSKQVTLVVANAGTNSESVVVMDSATVTLAPPSADGLPHSELEDQGWNAGYSAAGVVVEIGEGVTGIAPGDFVACGGAGKANHADYVSVPKNLVCKVPAGCELMDASTTTVGIIALQGVRRANPLLGERVAVIGLGLLGQITAQLLHANGCKVIGLDLDPLRVERAKKLGLAAGASDVNAYKSLVRDLTEGKGADRTIITAATKSDAVINLSMEITRAKGTVVIVGDVGLNVERAHFYRKEIDLLMSSSYGPGRYDRVYEEDGLDYPFSYVRWTLNRNMSAYMDMIASGRLNVRALVDRITPIDEAPKVYAELAAGGSSQPLGVIIEYPDDTRALSEPSDAAKITIRGHRKTPEGPLRYALVGAGAFGQSMLVPQMARRKDLFFLRGVVSRNATQGGNFARANRLEIFAADLESTLSGDGLDLMVISTRHHEHAEQAVKCLKAGKHVFVEKPLAINWDQLELVGETLEGLDNPPMLMVGFNRRFSPAVQKLKETLENRRGPMVVNYTLNGGYIPKDHWIQGPHGGGRNIGEACHMYDVFRCLAGAPVASIKASAIDPGSTAYMKTDNFIATLTYADGSVCSLMYTANGPKQGLPKERIEVHCDGEAYLVDNFMRLTRASDGKTLWEGQEVDKGHFTELSRFGEAIKSGGEPPIPLAEIMETTAVSLKIEDILNGREQE